MPGLDGLRALAVVAVMLYHGQDLTGLPGFLEPQGGFLGVEVFFVISGFLITSLLLREHDTTGSISLRSFWVRRARRLLPALYVFLAGTAALAALFATDALDKIRRELLGALFYVTNWVLIATDESYFEAAGRPSLLRHLWSLAIEEQFYLVWPLVVLFGLRLIGRRGMLALSLAGVVASTVLLWVLFDRIEQFGDVTSVYYRTDARAAALLIGAALAFVWQPWDSENRSGLLVATSGWARAAVDALGAAALMLVIAMQYLFTDRVIEWASYERLYHGGFLALSASTVIIIAAVAMPGGRLGQALGNPVFRWIGQRSYGLYLWHWPVFQMTRPRLDVDLDGYTLLVIRLFLTVALVELSYRLIEMPVRQRRFIGPVASGIRTPRGIILASAGALGLIMATTAVAVAIPTIDRTPREVAVAPTELASGPDAEATEEAPGIDRSIDPSVASRFISDAETVPGPTPTPAPAPALTPAPELTPAPPAAAPPPNVSDLAVAHPTPTPGTEAPADDPELLLLERVTPTPTLPPLPPPPPLSAPFDIATSQIHFVGDSVIAGAEGQLYRISPRVTVDGRTGRQWWEAEGEIRQMRASGLANDVVVVQLGNNGNFTPRMFDGVMNALSGARLVLFINIHAPVVWEAEVNAMLVRSVSRYPDQARLIDWYSASIDHPEYFIEDGTHLQGPGQVAFRVLIENTLRSLG